MAPCPVLLDLRVAGLAMVRSNSDDFVFRRGVFATLRGTFLVDLHLLLLLLLLLLPLLFFNRFVVGRGSRDVETAEPVVSCDA